MKIAQGSLFLLFTFDFFCLSPDFIYIIRFHFTKVSFIHSVIVRYEFGVETKQEVLIFIVTLRDLGHFFRLLKSKQDYLLSNS